MPDLCFVKCIIPKLYIADDTDRLPILSYFTAFFLLWLGETATLKFMADHSYPYLGGVLNGACLIGLNIIASGFGLIPKTSIMTRIMCVCCSAWVGIFIIYLFAPEQGDWKFAAKSADKLIVGMSIYLPIMGGIIYFKALDAIEQKALKAGAAPATYLCPECRKKILGLKRQLNTVISCPFCRKPIKCLAPAATKIKDGDVNGVSPPH